MTVTCGAAPELMTAPCVPARASRSDIEIQTRHERKLVAVSLDTLIHRNRARYRHPIGRPIVPLRLRLGLALNLAAFVPRRVWNRQQLWNNFQDGRPGVLRTAQDADSPASCKALPQYRRRLRTSPRTGLRA